MNIPDKYKWLLNEPGPKMIKEFLAIYGTKETIGEADNPVILDWAKELGLKDYTHDSIAWCGLEMAIVAKRAGKPVVKDPLWAANWLNFGVKVPIGEAMLGDVLVFKRTGGHHVALYIAESKDYFHCGGGNQSDAVSFAMISKDRCIGVRRPIYTEKPANVRKIFMDQSGIISHNEA